MMQQHRSERRVVTAGMLVSLFLSLWMVFPAPHEWLALLAVPLNEGWGIWLNLPAMWVVVKSARRLWEDRWAAFVLSLAVSTMLCATAPWRGLVGVAGKEGVALNPWASLVAGLDGDMEVVPKTEVFHQENGVTLSLDMYIPDGKGPFPTVMVIHAGGWQNRDKSDFPRNNAWLHQHGVAVVDIQYRLAPAPNWKSAVGDVKCALRWIQKNAERLQLDLNELTVLGRSAGGHLAMLVALTPGHPRLPSSCEGEEPKVKQVVSFYGAADLTFGYHNPANPLVYDGPATLRRFLGTTPDEDPLLYQLMSPITHVQPGAPRMLLFHGVVDQFVRHRQMELMAEKLTAMRVEHRAVSLPHAQHGFDFVVGGMGWQVATGVMTEFLGLKK